MQLVGGEADAPPDNARQPDTPVVPGDAAHDTPFLKCLRREFASDVIGSDLNGANFPLTDDGMLLLRRLQGSL